MAWAEEVFDMSLVFAFLNHGGDVSVSGNVLRVRKADEAIL